MRSAALGRSDAPPARMMTRLRRSRSGRRGSRWPSTPPPTLFLPPGTKPEYDGLAGKRFTNQVGTETPVVATQPTLPVPPSLNAMLVPTPDPGELFADMTEQIDGAPGQPAPMGGFLANYRKFAANPEQATQIMQMFGPSQVGVLTNLARSFAVSDAWYASAPCQTWPNRGFVHTGSSDGYIDNGDYIPYTNDTIFNVLWNQRVSWGVYHDTWYTPALTRIQFLKLWDFVEHFHHFSVFKSLCAAPADAPAGEKLPAYSFVEPRFLTESILFKTDLPEDYHPPHNVCLGERFVLQVYNAVRSSPYRDRILLVVTFDEHGGVPDHVFPPHGETVIPPSPYPVSRDGRFDFKRLGVRVPTIVISSYVQPGTVFRTNTQTPYDHTSILATLRDWKPVIAEGGFLPSPRIANAPTLAQVLTDSPSANPWPGIASTCVPAIPDVSVSALLDEPPGDLEMSIAVASERLRHYLAGRSQAVPAQAAVDAVSAVSLRAALPTRRHVVEFLRNRNLGS